MDPLSRPRLLFHLWPDSDERSRAAIDSFLGTRADSPRTGDTSAQVNAPFPDYLEKA